MYVGTNPVLCFLYFFIIKQRIIKIKFKSFSKAKFVWQAEAFFNKSYISSFDLEKLKIKTK